MYRRLLVPLEDAHPGQDVLSYAAEIAGHFGSTVTLLHVVHPSHPMSAPMFFGVGIPSAASEEESLQTIRETERGQVTEAGNSLAGKVNDLNKRGIEAISMVVIGQAAECILHVTGEGHIDLVVLSTSRRHGLKRLLNGDVTEEVIRKSRIPVLVIPDNDTS